MTLAVAEIRDRRHAIAARLASRRRAVQTRLARDRLLPWMKVTSPGYKAGWVHELLCDEIERFEDGVRCGTRPHLMVFMPPRHGKSEIMSRKAPVHMMARNPGWGVACASYGADLAEQMSRDARTCARDDIAAEVFPGIRPQVANNRYRGDYQRNDIDRVSQWKIGNGAQYKAVGVGGPLTGHGFNVGIIDDPFKDAADALSQRNRDKVWDWYGSTFYTRMDADQGGIIITHTRWHTDDLAGRLLEREPEKWRVVSLPAIAEEDEVHRKAGEALHPERWPLDRLREIQQTLPERWWAALFQQRPVALTGGMLQRPWFSERWSGEPQDIALGADQVWITVDGAKKAKDTSDFHSMQVWAIRGARWYLLDRVCLRLEYPEFRRRLDALYEKWKPVLTGVLIEDAANGTTYLQERRDTLPGLVEFNPQSVEGRDKSKEARAIRLQSLAEAGNVILPSVARCPWVEDLLDVWCAFPAVTHDDDVDSAAQLVHHVLKSDNGWSSFDLYTSF